MLTIDYGRPPWIALALACSFGTYGLVKKKAGVDGVESLTFETAVLAPLGAGVPAAGSAPPATGRSPPRARATRSLLAHDRRLVTAVPLICFGAAAIRIPMTTLGLLQYLAPTIQFVIGVLVFHEAMTPVKWVGFALVWLALAIFTVEALRHRRRQLRHGRGGQRGLGRTRRSG